MAVEVEIELVGSKKIALRLEALLCTNGHYSLKVTGPRIPMLPNEFFFTRDSALELAAAIQAELHE
jgi:hypothetical protein